MSEIAMLRQLTPLSTWLVSYTALHSLTRQMLSVKRDTVLALNSPWTTMPPLRLGKIPTGSGTANLFVTISDDDSALLRVDLYGNSSDDSAFQDAVVWYDRVFVGFGHKVYVIDPKKHYASEIYLGPFSGYFGHFYSSQDYFLVASGDSLLRIAPDGAILWQRPKLGLDGVVVNSVERGVILGEGEWDPPGGLEALRRATRLRRIDCGRGV